MSDALYDQTVRDLIGAVVGARLIELTQHDRDEFLEDGERHVDLLFDNGMQLSFYDNGDARLEWPDGTSTTIGTPDPDDPDEEVAL